MWFTNKVTPMSVVEDALKQRSWKYQQLDQNSVLAGFATESANYILRIAYLDAQQTLTMTFSPMVGEAKLLTTLIGRLPVLTVHPNVGHTPEQVFRVCEALLEQNYRLVTGSFERDPSDGEVRFSVAIPVRDGSVTVQQVSWCIDLGMAASEVAFQQIREMLGEQQSAPMQV